MFKKLLPFLGILIIFFVVAKRSCQVQPELPGSRKTGRTNTGEATELNRHAASLDYTKHSLCRMDCRKISEQDVEEILAEGTVNLRRSDPADKPCPTYVLEGYTQDKEHLRVVFAQCSNSTRVVTCINLDEEFTCDCPGDKPKKSTVQ
jgi:hypothetical protein